MTASAGAVRAAYFYEYCALPANFAGAPLINHVTDLASIGINTVMVKMLQDTPTPLQLQYWKILQSRSQQLGMTLYPFYNYQNDFYRNNYADPLRRYKITQGSYLHAGSSDGTLVANGVIGCPLDPKYIRAMLTLGFQRMPGATSVGWDPEFPGGPGGFHSYVNPCYCDGCKIDYYRSLYTPTEVGVVDPSLVTITATAVNLTAVDGSNGYLVWQRSQHRTLVARYAQQAAWADVAILDNDKDDHFIDASVSGMRDVGKRVTIYSELTYNNGNDATARTNGFASASDVGGLWLRNFTATALTAAAASGNLPAGYFMFTTYSFWVGQTRASQLSNPYDLADTIANYYTQLSGLNGASGSVVGTDHVITASAGANGTIAQSGAIPVTNGQNVEFAIEPDPGFVLTSILVDGADASDDPNFSGTAYVFQNVTTDHTIAVAFTQA